MLHCIKYRGFHFSQVVECLHGGQAIDVGALNFGRLGRRVVEGRFDGSSMVSDGGVMLLGQVDRKPGLLGATVCC